MSHYDKCPRGQQGGAEGHRRAFLVHRIIDGRLVCMDAELAHRYDEAQRRLSTSRRHTASGRMTP